MIQRILRRTQNVILRTIVLEERHTMDRTVLSVITEKITIDSIQNRTDQYFVGIQPSNGTFEQLTDKIVAMKVIYLLFYKSLYFLAKFTILELILLRILKLFCFTFTLFTDKLLQKEPLHLWTKRIISDIRSFNV